MELCSSGAELGGEFELRRLSEPIGGKGKKPGGRGGGGGGNPVIPRKGDWKRRAKERLSRPKFGGGVVVTVVD